MNIVIVEDEIKIRNGLYRLLSGYKEHNVIAKAKNGIEGLEAIISLHPDLVFTDIKMPEMDGLEMLEELKQRGIKCHSVILTGYAEFDYAKRALACGADDYLLKPITVDAVNSVLNNIAEKISIEATRLEANPHTYIRALISGALENTEENIKKARLIFGLHEGDNLWLVRGYSYDGNFSATDLDDRFPTKLVLFVSDDGKDLILLYNQSSAKYNSIEQVKDMLSRRISVIDSFKGSLWCACELEDISQLNRSLENTKKEILNAQMQGKQIIITEDAIDSKEYEYSQELEKTVEKLLVQGDKEAWHSWLDKYVDGFIGTEYDTYGVRQAFYNLGAFILQLSVKIWPDKGRQLRELNASEKMSRAKSLEELKDCLNQQADIIFAGEIERTNIQNYTILKAIAYIREHYSQKISQEEVANYLSITPEYLSTLFHREMNKNFSSFVNEFRVSHAKRLLKGSDLKIYEIAEKVGFTDTKYFNRVFKDVEGLSPKEFRER